SCHRRRRARKVPHALGTQVRSTPDRSFRAWKKGVEEANTHKGLEHSSTPSEDVRRRPTLPHPPECSTIGAIELSFRVRNGTGRILDDMTAVTQRDQPATHQHTSTSSRVVPQEPHSGREHVKQSHAKMMLK